VVAGAAGCLTTGTASERAVIRAKNEVAPALVHVRPVKEVFRQGQRQEFAVTGSGFIISNDGYVVTNEHVAGRSQYVRCVLFNQDEVDAEVVGVDPDSDIAVLKLQTDQHDLPAVKLGRSANLEAGQTVMALGSPHGLSRSVSLGIVSVTDRNLEGLGSSAAPFNNWIQTDAAINPGNSGGPLVNLKGEVVGINTRKLQGADNVGFAIPIDPAKEVIDELIAHGKVTRSSIGVILQEMTSITDDPTRPGVLIGDVDPLSPSYRARLRPGDVLLSVDGVPTNARYTEELPDIRKLIADKPIGESVTLRVERAGQVVDVPVMTEEKSAREGEEIEAPEWGCSISSLTPEVIRQARLNRREGVLVSGVQVGRPLHTAGIRRGDIILTIDGEVVRDLDQFERLYDERVHSGAPRVLLTIKRGALSVFVLVKQSGIPATDAAVGEVPE
jgi:serine protease Do